MKVVKEQAWKGKDGKIHKMDVSAIPNNMKKFMTISLGKDKTLMGSFQFLQHSLSKLADNLNDDDFKYTREVFGKSRSLMRCKGVYVYV